MLVLSRHRNESIVIDLRQWGLGLVTMKPVEFRNGKSGPLVRLGIEADEQIPVHRQEIFDRIESNQLIPKT